MQGAHSARVECVRLGRRVDLDSAALLRYSGSMNIDKLIRALPLKEMESSLLARAIYSHAAEAGMDTEKVRESVALASYLHRTHTRSVRSVMPRTHYIEHPLRNAVRLFRYGVTDQDVIIAAILHDTVEDALEEVYAIAMNKVGTVYSIPTPAQMRFRASERSTGRTARRSLRASPTLSPPRSTDTSRRRRSARCIWRTSPARSTAAQA